MFPPVLAARADIPGAEDEEAEDEVLGVQSGNVAAPRPPSVPRGVRNGVAWTPATDAEVVPPVGVMLRAGFPVAAVTATAVLSKRAWLWEGWDRMDSTTQAELKLPCTITEERWALGFPGLSNAPGVPW